MISPENAQFFSGIIMMVVLGLSIGNYATSIVYRLPRGLKIANEPPYCECERRMYLQVRDNFPFFSWLIARGKCRWCDIRIPALYAMVELSCGALFVSAFWHFGVGDELILVLALGVFLITQFALYYCEHRLYTIIVILVAGFGAMYRILLDDTVFGFIRGGFLGMMCGIALWQVRQLISKKKTSLPDYAILLGVAGGCVGKPALLALLLFSFALWLLLQLPGRRDKNLATASACLAISLSALILLYAPGALNTVLALI